jgi:type VII secretion-associated protein (TIGR03931 family)
VNEAVVVIGPGAVRGPLSANPDLVSVALECIDDRLAVWDDRVVTVWALWCDVLHEVGAGTCESAAVVVPTWWPRSRVEFVEDVLLTACARVVVLRRAHALRSETAAFVELGPNCIVVHPPDGEQCVVSRSQSADFVVDAVLTTLNAVAAVVIDVPCGASDVARLSEQLARRLRRRNVDVSLVDDDDVRRAVQAQRRVPVTRLPRRRIRAPRSAVVTGALAAVAALAGAVVTSGADGPDGAGFTWIVEGRVAFEAPDSWTVQRVTSGLGSARVQVNSPIEERLAIHVTQARVPDHETRQATADTLRVALEAQPDGVFRDFDADDVEADRSVVTYTEVRSAVAVDWVVVVDRGLRIAVGCQHPHAQLGGGPVCEHTVRTVHAIP